MLLGTRIIAQNDLRQFRVNYREFLAKGAFISTVVVTLPAGVASSIPVSPAQALSPDKEEVWFYLQAGAVNETFTATVVMTDSTGQIVHDTLSVSVVAP